MHQETLIGRDLEIATLDGLVRHARTSGSALLVKGEPGVGKSALLTAARHRAERQGMQVWAASGTRSEAGVPFAGLHQIIRPLLDRAHGAAHQRGEELIASFGREPSTACDIFTIAVATLEVLADVAKQQPLLIVVDDGHWLDSETAAVFGFVARRLGPEQLALVLAVRDGYDTALEGFTIPELRVEALDETSASVLLDQRAPELNPRIRARVLTEAAGNALALVELAAAS